MNKNPKPPFRVDVVYQFHGHLEDGYYIVATYERLEEAIAEARRITEEEIAEYDSFESWLGWGDAGLVYDSSGTLVWDGIIEARKEHDARKAQT